MMDRNKITNMLDKIIEWSLYVLIFIIPISKTAIEGCITVAFIAWVSKKVLTNDFALKKTPLNALLFAFVAANLISFVNAEFKLLFMRSMVSKCLKFVFLYFIIIETINTKEKLKNILTMALLSGVIVMLDSFLQRYIFHRDIIRFYPSFKYAPGTDPTRPMGFPTGPFPYPNDLAAWMLMTLMPALTLSIWGIRNIRAKIALASFSFPFLFLFYLTNARSAWIGFFISFFLTVFINPKKFVYF